MKKISLLLAFGVFAGLSSFFSLAHATEGAPGVKETREVAKQGEEESFIRAIRLVNNPDGSCTFQRGRVLNKTDIDSKYFFAQTHVDDYEKVAHPAPRMQYVVTLKGKLRFKVTNGDTFIIEPGTLLLAEDTKGAGHTWDLVEGDKWERLYIPLAEGADDHFIWPIEQCCRPGLAESPVLSGLGGIALVLTAEHPAPVASRQA